MVISRLYLDGGIVGDCFLVLMLLAVALKINRQLAQQSTYALIRFAVVSSLWS